MSYCSFFRLGLSLGLGLALLTGCAPAPSGGPTAPGKEHAIHELREITDRAEVEKLALQVTQGAKPLPGDVGLVALQAGDLIGVAIAPEAWSKPGAKPKSTDIAIYLLSVPNDQLRFREPLLNKLKTSVSTYSGHAPTKPVVYGPFVLKVGGYDYPGRKAQSQSANGMKGVEYWLDLPREGRQVQVVGSGLPGFEAYFPDQRFVEFLNQLPKQDLGSTPAPQ